MPLAALIAGQYTYFGMHKLKQMGLYAGHVWGSVLW